jgi:peptidoglycan-N-acetylglucosamine deacetylase
MIAGAIKRIGKLLLLPVVRERGPGVGAYLTFDDGPHVDHTRPILAALDQAGVKATFFMIGEEMERYPELVTEVKSRGHAIGLHSYAHRHPGQLRMSELMADLRRAADVASRFGIPFHFYRPPYGELSIFQILWCAWHRVRIVLWSQESRDSFAGSADEVIVAVEAMRVKDGDILLFHDDTPVTVAALPAVLQRLIGAGVRFAVLGEAG